MPLRFDRSVSSSYVSLSSSCCPSHFFFFTQKQDKRKRDLEKEEAKEEVKTGNDRVGTTFLDRDGHNLRGLLFCSVLNYERDMREGKKFVCLSCPEFSSMSQGWSSSVHLFFSVLQVSLKKRTPLTNLRQESSSQKYLRFVHLQYLPIS